MKTKKSFSGEVFPRNIYPMLYSKRGFEKSRLRAYIPKIATELAYFGIGSDGKKLIIKS
jgi:hypothetical protein